MIKKPARRTTARILDVLRERTNFLKRKRWPKRRKERKRHEMSRKRHIAVGN